MAMRVRLSPGLSVSFVGFFLGGIVVGGKGKTPGSMPWMNNGVVVDIHVHSSHVYLVKGLHVESIIKNRDWRVDARSNGPSPLWRLQMYRQTNILQTF